MRELVPLLAARFATATSAEWLARLDAAEVPAGPLLDILDAFSTEQALAIRARVPMTHPALGAVDQVRSPFDFAATPATIRTPPPLLGEHSDEVLAELGYDAAAAARLRADGARLESCPTSSRRRRRRARRGRSPASALNAVPSRPAASP